MEASALLMSIRPKFAKKIFEGSKTFELRRVRPNVSHGDAILVYVSSPEKQIQAMLTVDHVIQKDLSLLWEEVENDAGISREEFDDYFMGLDQGVAIKIKEVILLSSPLDLSTLRELIPGFKPPQM